MIFYNLGASSRNDGLQEAQLIGSMAVTPGLEVIKIMLNSAEHEILDAHKYKKISRYSALCRL